MEGIFQIYASDFNARGLNLYQNFRSAPVLRRIQNRMITRMDPHAVVPDDKIAGSGGTIRIFHSADDIEEAARITDWIRERIAEGTPESEIAILFAKQPELYAVALVAALTDAGIRSETNNNFKTWRRSPHADHRRLSEACRWT